MELRFNEIIVRGNNVPSIVHAITEDSDGYIWFGTSDGLLFYDGYEFKGYQADRNNPNAISSNTIRDLAVGPNGYLWIGTHSNGLNKFHKKSKTFKHYVQSDGKDHNFSSLNAWRIKADSKNNLWIGTWGNGLFRCTPKNEFVLDETFECFTSKNTGLSQDFVYEMFEDSGGLIWIGTHEGGLNCLNPETQEVTVYKPDSRDQQSLHTLEIHAVTEDSQGNLWIGNYGKTGLQKLDRETGKFKSYPNCPLDHITAILEVRPGYLLIGSENGLRLFDVERESFSTVVHEEYNPRKNLKNQPINCLFKDQNEIIWIGTNNGAYRQVIEKGFTPVPFIPGSDNTISQNTIRGITTDKNGKVWVATPENGLSILDPITQNWSYLNKTNSELPSNAISSVYADTNNNMWIGTTDGYLCQYDQSDKSLRSFLLDENPPMLPNIIQGMVEDEIGRLWIGTENGICRFDRTAMKWDFLRHDPTNAHSLSSNKIQSNGLVFDTEGNLWIGTFNGGLNKIPAPEIHEKIPRIQHWKNKKEDSKSLANNNILAIYNDEKGILWLGTYGGGVIRFDPTTEEATSYTVDQGLSNNLVYGIEGDENGHIWCSTAKGLSRITPDTEQIRVYTAEDGLVSNTFYWGATHQGTDGKLYFGGRDGFNIWDPQSIQDNQTIPPIILTSFLVLGDEKPLEQNINSINEIELEPNENFFSIHFSALDYTDPRKNQYRYKLDGIDKDWVDNGNHPVATYTNVPPGKYIFKVIGSNNDGLWNAEGKSVSIIIHPRFYQTLLFKILLIGGFIVLTILVFRYRTRQIRTQNEELEDRVQRRTAELRDANQLLEVHQDQLEDLVKERTKELESAKNKAEESDRLKSSFLANMSHEIRTPLNAIVGFSSLLIEAESTPEEQMEWVEAVTSNSNHLVLLVDDILDLSKLEAHQLEIRKRSVKLIPFLNSIHEYWYRSNKNHKLQIKFENKVRNQNLSIHTDELRLKQVLTNLMSNACKFTEQGSVSLSAHDDDKALVLKVTDTGIGISKENQEFVFQRFAKIEDSQEKLYRGSGLGLAISKALVQLLGGTISVESHMGEGSVFKVTLPIEQTHSTTSERSSSTASRHDHNWKDLNILIAEDEYQNFRYLEQLLKPTEVNIDHASDGLETLKYFENGTKYDLVLMDIKMPQMDGFEVLKRIREIRPQQIVIAQTAYAKPEDIDEMIQAGFSDYLSKPIFPKNLIEKIENSVASSS